MAKWSDKLNQMTHSAISKSKEVAGVAKLNMDNTSLNLDIKSIQTQIGAYVLKNKLLAEDASVREWMEKVETLKARIESNIEKIRELKNVNVCPDCGAEVDRSSRFCNKCGAELTIPASASEVEETSDTAETGEAEAVEAETEAAAREVDAEVEVEAEAAAREVNVEAEAEAAAKEVDAEAEAEAAAKEVEAEATAREEAE